MPRARARPSILAPCLPILLRARFRCRRLGTSTGVGSTSSAFVLRNPDCLAGGGAILLQSKRIPILPPRRKRAL